MFHEYLQGSLEALLFAAGEPLTLDKPQVWELLTMLEESYNEENRGLCLRKVAGGYQLCAKPQHYALLKQLERVQEVKLSAAAMETLAIVAFKQPVTRGEMEFLLTFGLNSLKDLPALPDEDSSGPEQISLLDSLKDADSNTQNDGV